MKQEFIFDAILSYDKRKISKREIKAILMFIKELTIEANDTENIARMINGFSEN